jgi:hypothetical protein
MTTTTLTTGDMVLVRTADGMWAALVLWAEGDRVGVQEEGTGRCDEVHASQVRMRVWVAE